MCLVFQRPGGSMLAAAWERAALLLLLLPRQIYPSPSLTHRCPNPRPTQGKASRGRRITHRSPSIESSSGTDGMHRAGRIWGLSRPKRKDEEGRSRIQAVCTPSPAKWGWCRLMTMQRRGAIYPWPMRKKGSSPFALPCSLALFSLCVAPSPSSSLPRSGRAPSPPFSPLHPPSGSPTALCAGPATRRAHASYQPSTQEQ